MKSNKFSFIGNSATYPNTWSNLFCYRDYNEKVVVNENHNLLQYVNHEKYSYILGKSREKKSIIETWGEEILS